MSKEVIYRYKLSSSLYFILLFILSFMVKRSLSKMSVKITSYNVLSTHLGAPDYFTSCNPKYLDANYRLNKLKEKLDVEINQNSIICLQEVSNTCAGSLHSYFSKKGYHFITGLYGNKFNNYMGVGIAGKIYSFY